MVDVENKNKSISSKTGILKVTQSTNEKFDSTLKSSLMKLELTYEKLTFSKEYKNIKKEETLAKSGTFHTSSFCSSFQDFRIVKLIKEKGVGFGFTVKGGSEYHLPILISSIIKNGPADKTRKLFIGDMIIKVNDEAISTILTSQEEICRLLKNCKFELYLTVKHYKSISPIVIKYWKKNENLKLVPFFKKEENEKSEHLEYESINNTHTVENENNWIDVISVSLLNCHLTRYIHDSDKVRSNGFEVKWLKESSKICKFVNKLLKQEETLVTSILAQSKLYSTAIVRCNNFDSFKEWIKAIDENVEKAVSDKMKQINGNVSKEDQVLYMGWISQGLSSKRSEPHRPCYKWCIRYIVIKGGELYLYSIPPKNLLTVYSNETIDWKETKPFIFKSYQSLLRCLQKFELVDERENCFLLSTINDKSGQPLVFYFSVETNCELMKILSAWNKATYYSVTRLESRTFSVISEGKSGQLTLNWKFGFIFYDLKLKRYDWHYKFSKLKTSSDDGKNTLWLCFRIDSQDDEVFQNPTSLKKQCTLETREVIYKNLQSLLYCMHAFLIAKVISVDPDFFQRH